MIVHKRLEGNLRLQVPGKVLREFEPSITAVKDHVMKDSETAFNNSNVNYFWSIKNSSGVIKKLRLRNFQGSQVSSFHFINLIAT